MRRHRALLLVATFFSVAHLVLQMGPAVAACALASSSCYPWAIEEGAKDTVILENIPNNAVTSVIYRICLCAPDTAVDIVFRYPGKAITIGTLGTGKSVPICRDYRIQTSRSSQLLVSRKGQSSQPIEGCYTALSALP